MSELLTFSCSSTRAASNVYADTSASRRKPGRPLEDTTDGREEGPPAPIGIEQRHGDMYHQCTLFAIFFSLQTRDGR